MGRYDQLDKLKWRYLECYEVALGKLFNRGFGPLTSHSMGFSWQQ